MTTPSAPIVITPGDPLGVGAEVGVLAACDQEDVVLVGDEDLWRRAAELRSVDFASLRVVPSDPAADPEHADIPELAAIATAVQGCRSGRFSALSTGPIHKESLLRRGFDHAGHTSYLAELCGLDREDAVMMFAGGRLRVVLATVHLPLRRVHEELSSERIVRVCLAGTELLVRGLGIDRPRVAVCGLNPHAGEGGRLGEEDETIVAPAVEELRSLGVDASGPLPADTLFAHAAQGAWDLVVAQYHDQGLIPVKTLDFGRCVNITAGLPIVRTSVDHGTARDIAWTGKADPRHAHAALEMARRLSR
ncbi:MAG: 4-hydroxythreonine-4-phosphate dehydrogenase PdxA [Myxococcota bacterium]|nr:4-hydroxythreonine-4-phosphate dehydrogenase PdxA [Myxococcota bacterium]